MISRLFFLFSFLFNSWNIFSLDFDLSLAQKLKKEYHQEYGAVTEYKKTLFYSKNENEKKIACSNILQFEIKIAAIDSINYFSKHCHSLLETNILLLTTVTTLDVLRNARSSKFLDVFSRSTKKLVENFDTRKKTAVTFFQYGYTDYAIILLKNKTDDFEYELTRPVLLKKIRKYDLDISYWNSLYAIIPGGLFLKLKKIENFLISFFSVSLLTAGGWYGYTNGYPVTATISSLFALKFYVDSVTQSIKLISQKNYAVRTHFIENQLKMPNSYIFFSSTFLF